LQWRKGRVNLHLEKFQMGPMLEEFSRILYLDADVLISPKAPDFFDMASESELGVVTDPPGAIGWKRDEEMTAIAKKRGALSEPPPPYFNAGVLLFSRAHRELFRFDPGRLVPGRWPDQTYLNYQSAAWKLPRRYLDAKANFLPGNPGWEDESTRLAAWAVHYAGPEAKPVMKADAARFAAM
ncbi:MAG TPA: glycosyltransferase, partial [Opitutales bacterium]|nr:glycosyltransferase [Opitutales bacterium]